MRLLRFAAQAVALVVILTFYILPSFMIPFVKELPYLHNLNIWQRLPISLVIFSLSYLLIFVFAKPGLILFDFKQVIKGIF